MLHERGDDLFVREKCFQGKKRRYLCLIECYRDADGKVKQRHIKYLGKRPSEILSQMVNKGQFTLRQVAAITWQGGDTPEGRELTDYLNNVREQMKGAGRNGQKSQW